MSHRLPIYSIVGLVFAFCMVARLHSVAAQPVGSLQSSSQSRPGHAVGGLLDTTRFSPRIEGGYWEYVLTEHHGLRSLPTYVSLRLKGDTVIADLNYQILTERRYDSLGGELDVRRCGVHTDDSGRYSIIGLAQESGRCGMVLNPFNSRSYEFVIEKESIRIGGLSYDVDLAHDYFDGWGTGGGGGGFERRYAANIGLYFYYEYIRPHWQDAGAGWDKTYELQYADVRGGTFGASVVAVEKSSNFEGSLRIESVYPNPFQNVIYCRIEGVAGRTAQYELFDMLGRRVSDGVVSVGSAAVGIEAGPGSSGMYILRVRSRDGQVATRTLTRIVSSGQ